MSKFSFRRFRRDLSQIDNNIVASEYVCYLNNDEARTFKCEVDLVSFVKEYSSLNTVFYLQVFVHHVKQLIFN